MYELIILSLLMRIPLHGYLITRIINDAIGPYTKMSNGRLYPLLTKLEKDEFINANITNRGKMQSRTYTITALGKNHFHSLMMDTDTNPANYKDLFLFKVSVFEFLKPSERLFLLDHYKNFCIAHIEHLMTEKKDTNKWEMNAEQIKEILLTMDHRIQQWQLELQWVNYLRENS